MAKLSVSGRPLRQPDESVGDVVEQFAQLINPYVYYPVASPIGRNVPHIYTDYTASEKLEIIRLVEQSHLPTKQTIDKLGIPRTPFYRWYDKYLTGGAETLADRSPKPLRVWNRIPDDVRQRIVDMALDEPELSPRELAVRFA